MKFLLFNLAVIAALFYLFRTDPGGSDLRNDHREAPLQSMRQELESLARDIAAGRRQAEQATPQLVAAETPKDDAPAPQAEVIDASLGEARDRPIPTASSETQAPSAGQDVARPAIDAPQDPVGDPREGAVVADPVASQPQLDDPAVAQRRAEVLDGVAPPDDGLGATPVKGGTPMSPEERLRKLYSLAEEMELLYVSKMTR